MKLSHRSHTHPDSNTLITIYLNSPLRISWCSAPSTVRPYNSTCCLLKARRRGPPLWSDVPSRWTAVTEASLDGLSLFQPEAPTGWWLSEQKDSRSQQLHWCWQGVNNTRWLPTAVWTHINETNNLILFIHTPKLYTNPHLDGLRCSITSSFSSQVALSLSPPSICCSYND